MLSATEFQRDVEALSIGKKLPEAVYLHRDTLEASNPRIFNLAKAVSQALKVEDEHWNIVKLSRRQFGLSLLHYPTFFSEAYPGLVKSISVDLTKLTHKIVNYTDSDNPPILHRKELFVLPEHPQYNTFRTITIEGETAGLYENTHLIGFKASWEAHIAKHGYVLVDGRLFRASMLQDNESLSIDRHKTALVRHSLSTPMKFLAKHGFLGGKYSVFDYGCGRGDDLRELQCHGLDALGWDPNYFPEEEKSPANIVNLGFVLNVIEDKHERIEALLVAWELAQSLMVVSVMLANDEFIAQFTPFRDGVITSRNTFQKYYSQSELKEFIETTLDENAIAIGPGIFYVFRDKNLEQQFQQNRQKQHYKWRHLTAPEPVTETQARLLFTQHQPLFETFWKCCLDLGRLPAEDEFADYKQLNEIVGSPKKTLRLIGKWYNLDELEQAAAMRKEDLLVYFALAQFQKHKGFAKQPESLKRDIKAFFGNYNVALKQAKELLLSIADPKAIADACLQQQQLIPSKLELENETPHSLTFHKIHLLQLSPLLRIYTGAALQLYGELDDIDLIKIHFHSGKLTLLGYDDFTKATPLLAERVKIKMAEQIVDFFDYVDTVKRPPLHDKQLFIS